MKAQKILVLTVFAVSVNCFAFELPFSNRDSEPCPTVTSLKNPKSYTYDEILHSEFYRDDFQRLISERSNLGDSRESAYEYAIKALEAKYRNKIAEPMDFTKAMEQVQLEKEVKQFKACSLSDMSNKDLVVRLDKEKVQKIIDEQKRRISSVSDECVYKKINSDATKAKLTKLQSLCDSMARREVLGD
ncbi:hypothetical protein LC147_12070 [Vibrio harveyi]|uniref:hypothetical protein n=1 Tax=Vibrio harveyi TaxID=669 RepID=UPI003BB61363